MAKRISLNCRFQKQRCWTKLNKDFRLNFIASTRKPEIIRLCFVVLTLYSFRNVTTKTTTLNKRWIKISTWTFPLITKNYTWVWFGTISQKNKQKNWAPLEKTATKLTFLSHFFAHHCGFSPFDSLSRLSPANLDLPRPMMLILTDRCGIVVFESTGDFDKRQAITTRTHGCLGVCLKLKVDREPHRAGEGDLFTITGRINCGSFLAGRK